MPKHQPSQRRYNTDLLVYEAFYVSLRNALIVGLVPFLVFLFLSAVEEFRMTEGFLSTIITMTEIAFVISFFINFLYYVYFIKVRRSYACSLSVLISVSIAFIIFFSDLKNVLNNTQQSVIVICWFLLLGIIMIVNKNGNWPNKESQYENESWLYRHELAAAHAEKEQAVIDPEDQYMHKYVERPANHLMEDPEDDQEEETRLT